MIDFSKLNEITPEKREINEKKRRERAIAQDFETRSQRCEHRLNITIDCDPECRFACSGSPILHLRGLDDKGRSVSVDWFAPSHMDREEFERYFEKFLPETPISPQGYWKPFNDRNGKTHFTFIAQFIELR